MSASTVLDAGHEGSATTKLGNVAKQRHSTPFSLNLASITQSSEFQAVASIVDNYIGMDISDPKIVTIETFLQGMGVDERMLGEQRNQTFDDIATSLDMTNLREEYIKESENEATRYGPFCNMANYVAQQLHKGSPPRLFCRNDPHEIRGPLGSKRKPDVIMLDSKDKYVKDERWKNHNKGSVGVDWTWSTVLFVFEFKQRKKVLTLLEDSNPVAPPLDQDAAIEAASGQDDEMRPTREKKSTSGGTLAVSSNSKKRAMQKEGESGTSNKRRKEGEPREELMKQSARYAVDQLSHVFNRRHCISGLLLDERLWMAYYDHGGVILSKPFNFLSNPYLFVLLIKALEGMSLEECGFIKGLGDVSKKAIVDDFPSSSQESSQPSVPDSDDNYEPSGAGQKKDPPIRPLWRMTIKGHELLIYGSLIKRVPYGLITRASRVHAMKCRTLDPSNPNRKFAIKSSWPLQKRTSEVVILTKAKEVLEALDANPEAKDALKSSDGSFNYISGRKLADCLPEVLLHEDRGNLMNKDFFRSRVANEGKLTDGEDRVHRWIAFELLTPLYELTDLDHFKQAIRDIVSGHYFLCKEDIIHRDISLGNVMVRVEDDGIHGVLNDWDLAQFGKPEDDEHTGTRTGTRPFMATELLVHNPPPPHLMRFDWESIFYVIVWIACSYDKGKEVKTPFLSDWNSPDDMTVRKSKLVLTGSGSVDILQHITPFYAPLEDTWIIPLQELFGKVHGALNARELAKRKGKEAKFKDSEIDTVGGIITFEKFWSILQQ